jgi:hypothetical protein
MRGQRGAKKRRETESRETQRRREREMAKEHAQRGARSTARGLPR